MKYWSLLLVVVVFFGCKSTETSAKKRNEIVLTIERGSCHGQCPQYEMVMYDDKTVSFKGVKFIEPIGGKKITLSQIDYELIVKACNATGMSEMQGSYHSPARDLQLTKIKFDTKKITYHTGKAPEKLVKLLTTVEAIVFPKLK